MDLYSVDDRPIFNARQKYLTKANIQMHFNSWSVAIPTYVYVHCYML